MVPLPNRYPVYADARLGWRRIMSMINATLPSQKLFSSRKFDFCDENSCPFDFLHHVVHELSGDYGKVRVKARVSPHTKYVQIWVKVFLPLGGTYVSHPSLEGHDGEAHISEPSNIRGSIQNILNRVCDYIKYNDFSAEEKKTLVQGVKRLCDCIGPEREYTQFDHLINTTGNYLPR